MNPVDPRIARIAAERYGVFTYEVVLRSGGTKRVIERRLASGRWERLHQGVYRLSGAPGSWRQQVLAACLAASDGAVASHRAAGGLWRLAGFEQHLLEITVPRGRRPRLRGVIVHQLPLPGVDIAAVDAIPVTTPARTLLDLTAVSPADVVEEALDDALRRGLVSLPRLRWRARELGRRSGSGTIRKLLDARNNAARKAQSVLETRLLRLLKRARLPIPIPQYTVRDRGRVVAVVDFAYPEQRIAIEADGYRWHSGRNSWQRDLARRNELTRLGWRVIHVTAHDLDHDPERIVEAVGMTMNKR